MPTGPNLPEKTGYSWPEYRFYVLHELNRIGDVLLDVSSRLKDIENAQARADERHRMNGALAGLAASALFEGLRMLFVVVRR